MRSLAPFWQHQDQRPRKSERGKKIETRPPRVVGTARYCYLFSRLNICLFALLIDRRTTIIHLNVNLFSPFVECFPPWSFFSTYSPLVVRTGSRRRPISTFITILDLHSISSLSLLRISFLGGRGCGYARVNIQNGPSRLRRRLLAGAIIFLSTAHTIMQMWVETKCQYLDGA